MTAAFGLAGLARVWASLFVRNRDEDKTLLHSNSLPHAPLIYLVRASTLRANQATQCQCPGRQIQGPYTDPPIGRLESHPKQPLSHLPRQPISPTRKSCVPCRRQLTCRPTLQLLRSTCLCL